MAETRLIKETPNRINVHFEKSDAFDVDLLNLSLAQTSRRPHHRSDRAPFGE
jgi:hypothetical protein